jgi:hypothetical protein
VFVCDEQKQASAELRRVLCAAGARGVKGKIAAAKELFQRLLGPPEAVDFLERMGALEQHIAEMTQKRGPAWRN